MEMAEEGRPLILVVDDEEENLHVLRRLLSSGGHSHVQTTRDPAEGVRLFGERRPDLLLLDLHMPGLDGFAVMEKVRALIEPDDFVPILVLTGDPSVASRRRALSEGAKDFVSKPFEREEVLLRIRNLLETRRLHLRLREHGRRLEQEVQERTVELKQSHIETLERLAVAAEYRDDDTGEHIRRVGETAADLAVRLALPAAEVEIIRHAAPLHDIGKIGIPDAILLKPGKLTPEEFTTIKTHTTIGGRMLAGGKTALLQVAASIAVNHHERWDGRGYPAGIPGPEIPVAARITAVVDVFDALTSDRPYKKAWPVDQAVAEIRKQRGTQFDPDVADAMLARF